MFHLGCDRLDGYRPSIQGADLTWRTTAATPRSGVTSSAVLGQLLAGSSTLWGTFAVLGSPNSAEVLARCGLDFVIVDCQHGISGAPLADVVRAIAGAALPLVRVVAADAAAVGQALDHGAAAVIVPMIEHPAAAAAMVRACRYPPDGDRSYGPMRALLHGDCEPAERPLCFVMIETARGLAARDQIAAVPGVDGIFVGPSDLAISLGRDVRLAGEDPVLDAAMAGIAVSCAQHGIVAAVQTSTPNEALRRQEQGFRLISMRSDFALLRTGAAQLSAQVRIAN